MKTRLLWIAIAVVGLAALYFGIARPPVSTVPRNLRDSMTDLRPPLVPSLEPPALVIPPTPTVKLPPLKSAVRFDPIPGPPEVPIQNGATIDFSTGAPVIKMQGKDQEALDAALKQMAEVAKGAAIEVKK